MARAIYEIIHLLNSLKNKYRIDKYKIQVGKKTVLNGEVQFVSDNRGKITIGENTKINSGKQFNQIGGDTRTVIRTINSGIICIGDNVGISNSALVARNSIMIDDDVRIGGSCKIYDNDFHSLRYEYRLKPIDDDIKSSPIHIKRGAFICAETIILKGVTIGEMSVVGAGSVVTHDIPDYEIWAGNPARFVRKINRNDGGCGICHV